MTELYTCPLCSRPLPGKSSKHHLTPRMFGGRDIVLLHRICHRQIHATFTERELLNYYHTIERILKHDNIKKFVKWIRNKPLGFHAKTRNTQSKESKKY